jgi:hypothetical protein
MWPFYSQITLAVMQSGVRWSIPDSSCDTIQVWQADGGFKTYWLGDAGLKMLASAGIYPKKAAQ